MQNICKAVIYILKCLWSTPLWSTPKIAPKYIFLSKKFYFTSKKGHWEFLTPDDIAIFRKLKKNIKKRYRNMCKVRNWCWQTHLFCYYCIIVYTVYFSLSLQVLGGETIDERNWPWLFKLQTIDSACDNSAFTCTATLISP